MLQAVFYARFHAERGPTVIHQYPHSSIIPSAPSSTSAGLATKTLVSWPDVSAYIIPPYDVCNAPLALAVDGDRHILGFPVSLEDPKYERNRLTFNVGFVVAAASPGSGRSHNNDLSMWSPIVRKTAAFFTQLELEDGLLQAEEELPGLTWAGDADYPSSLGVVHDLLAALFRDLTAYAECCVPVGANHVLNLRLSSPTLALPPPDAEPIHPWTVPILVRALPPEDVWTWDLTLSKIHPYLVTGVLPIAQIAKAADVDPRLVRRAVRSLVRLGAVVCVDLFHFRAVYACTSAFVCFVQDVRVQDECRRYIVASSTASATDDEDSPLPSRQTIVDLYAALSSPAPPASSHPIPSSAGEGTVSAFVLAHASSLSTSFYSIDVRRFVSFGVLKGFLRRRHSYALAVAPSSAHYQRISGSRGLSTSPTLSFRARPGVGIGSSLSRSYTGPQHPSLASSLSRSPTATRTPLSSSYHERQQPTLSSSYQEQPLASSSPQKSRSHREREDDPDRAWRKAALTSGWATPPSLPSSSHLTSSGPPLSSSTGGAAAGSNKSVEEVRSEEDQKLWAFADGAHCLDEVCLSMGMGEREVLERLRAQAGRDRGRGDVVTFVR